MKQRVLLICYYFVHIAKINNILICTLLKMYRQTVSVICRKCGNLVVEISKNSLRRFIDSNGAAHEIWLLCVQALPNKPLA